MTRIRVGDHWTWSTWLRFESPAEAVAHARESDKVVRFRSKEWAALLQTTESASLSVKDTPQENPPPPKGEGETFVEFVLRFLASQPPNQP